MHIKLLYEYHSYKADFFIHCLISIGMATRPKSSVLLTTPVAFIYNYLHKILNLSSQI